MAEENKKDYMDLLLLAELNFTYSHTISNFFVDNYPEPIFENGI